MKQCKTCGESKDLSEFFKNRGKPMARCKPCSKPSDHDLWKTHLAHHYGLTFDEWTEMLVAQQGRCYVCAEAVPHKDLVVDHCHVTGDVGKLLCRHCNIAAGALRDNPTTARELANYLEEVR